ncbi:MAG TPA: hypothetical protein VGP01_05565 [Rhizomicrobium sp.]|nr:hypothetical protein [Rhizomicrobium sp.]
MRISKAALNRGWIWATGSGVIVYAILTSLDLQLKSLTGVSTANLESLASGLQYRLAFHAWAPEPYAARAGFLLGFAYLAMPLYALSFFFSGVIAAEHFTPGKNRFRRWVLLAAMVAPVGALLDALLKGLQLTMLLTGADDSLAHLAAGLANAKTAAMAVGLALLLGALAARFAARKSKG